MLGLEGNLGRAPRTWFKPNTNSQPHAPYERNEDFNAKSLGRVWQWNHNPDDSKWSLKNGRLRLQSMPADLNMDDKSVPKPKLIFESCGSRERPDGINESVKALTEAGLNAVGYISPNTGHEFLTWRRSLKELAPLLFK